MIEAGMVSNDLDDLYELIELCIKNDSSTIQVAGYTALWHLLLRFKSELSAYKLISYINMRFNKSNAALDVVNCIIDDLYLINRDVWNKIKND